MARLLRSVYFQVNYDWFFHFFLKYMAIKIFILQI